MAAPGTTAALAVTYTGPSAIAEGATAEDFRREYRIYGEPCRIWLPKPAVGGRPTLTELRLDARIRVMRYNTVQEYQDVQGNLVKVGVTGVSVLPDEIQLREDARIVFTHAKRLYGPEAFRSVSDFKRTAATNSSDRLPHFPVGQIVRVINDSGTVLTRDTDYTLSGETGGSLGIKWLTTAVAVGSKCVIEWRAYPAYRVTTEEKRGSPIGSDGKLLPVRWQLTAEALPTWVEWT